MQITSKKTYYGIIAILGMLTGLIPFSVDMYLPGFPAIAQGLNSSVAKVGISLASFFLGICIGQLIYGPLMDRFGRKKPLIIGLCIYIFATIGCIYSVNVEQLITFRFIQALGGCAGMVASRAAVRDLFPVTESAKVFSMLMLVMGVAPIIAPGVGSFVVTAFHWQSIFIILGIIAIGLLLGVILFLPESKKADASISLSPLKIVSEYFVVIRNPTFLLYTMVSAFSMALLFAYISSSPFIFMTLHGLNEHEFGIAFGFNAFCLIAGSQLNRFLLTRKPSEWIANQTAIIQFIIAITFLIVMLNHINGLMITFLGMSSCLFLTGVINPNTTALALQPFSKNAGMAAAFSGFFQMGISALSALCVSYFFNGTAVPMAAMIAGSSALSLLSLSIIVLLKRSGRFKIVEETIV